MEAPLNIQGKGACTWMRMSQMMCCAKYLCGVVMCLIATPACTVQLYAPGSFSGPMNTAVVGGGWLMSPKPAMSCAWRGWRGHDGQKRCLAQVQHLFATFQIQHFCVLMSMDLMHVIAIKYGMLYVSSVENFGTHQTIACAHFFVHINHNNNRHSQC